MLRKSEAAPRAVCQRKFFYLFTCEYCFSHYVAAAVVLDDRAIACCVPDWRGAILAWFTLVWVANVYMSLFGRLRLDIKRERVEIKWKSRGERGRTEVEATFVVERRPRRAAATRPRARPAHTA